MWGQRCFMWYITLKWVISGFSSWPAVLGPFIAHCLVLEEGDRLDLSTSPFKAASDLENTNVVRIRQSSPPRPHSHPTPLPSTFTRFNPTSDSVLRSKIGGPRIDVGISVLDVWLVRHTEEGLAYQMKSMGRHSQTGFHQRRWIRTPKIRTMQYPRAFGIFTVYGTWRPGHQTAGGTGAAAWMLFKNRVV